MSVRRDADQETVDVSVVIPAYNERESIPICVAAVKASMSTMGRLYEILVVDDGSTDDTALALAELTQCVPQLIPLRLRDHGGQTAALVAGFRAARGRIIVTLDADLQNDPADIPKLVELTQQWDVVCGYRAERHDSLVRRLSSRIANSVRNRLTGDDIRDVGCSMRAFRTECVRGLRLYSGMHRFLPTLFKWDGWSVTQVPVAHNPRRWGRTKYGIRNRLFRALRDLMAVRWMKSRWIGLKIAERIT